MVGREIKVPFRYHTPVRSDVGERSKYQLYKKELRRDFKERCGYCDDPDKFFGGIRGYHIDHFAPKSKFPELEIEYSNLVYSCPLCNRAKYNTWLGNDSTVSHNGSEGFIDPCDEEYECHLGRDGEGRILGGSELGRYMVEKLSLYLLRHAFIWQDSTTRRNTNQTAFFKSETEPRIRALCSIA